MIFMTFASSCIFLAIGIRAGRVAACSLLAYRWASNIANFSNALLAIAELRARPVKLSTIDCRHFFFSCAKGTKLKLLKQAHLPSVQVSMQGFRRALLVRDITATQAVLSRST